jgi:hypothetical protein
LLIIYEETCHSCRFATITVKYIRTKYGDIIRCIHEECSKGGYHGAFRKDEIETLKKHPSGYLKCDLWESKGNERKG